jgi:hypothetical protein
VCVVGIREVGVCLLTGGGGCDCGDYVWSVCVVIKDVGVCLLTGDGGGVIVVVMCGVCVL